MQQAGRALVGAAWLGLGCQGSPRVDVSTSVATLPSESVDVPGPVHVEPAADASPPVTPSARANQTRAPAGFTPQAPRTDEAFTALVAGVRSGSWEAIALAARNLARADPAVWPAVRSELLAERSARKSDYKTVLSTIGGDVPDRYGHFDRAWKKAHGYSVRLSVDWFEDLLALPSDKISKLMRPVYRDCVLQSALLRAASHVSATDPARASEVIETLLDAAYVHHGTFRDEVGRAIVAVGPAGVAALVRASADRAHEDETIRRRAEYALFNLDRLELREPRRALVSARDDLPRYLELIDAHGAALLPEAAAPLLELADDPVPRVREHARAAFLAFVSGRAGATEQRTLRLLGGATTTRSMLAAHRSVAAAAVLDALSAVDPDAVEPRCSLYLPSGVRDRTCEAQPERHARSYFAWLDHDRRTRDAAALAAALESDDPIAAAASLDALLASGVQPPDPGPVVEVFVHRARAARDAGEPLRAAALLRKSAMLIRDVNAPLADQLRVSALRLEADSPGVTASGRDMLLAAAGEVEVPRATASRRAMPGVFAPVLAAMIALLASLAVLGHWRAGTRRT